jgi:hypothetical protein
MFDLDDSPAYAGKSSNLRSRLRQHLIRQDSSVASYGRLDPWDIASVGWWTTKQTDEAEQDLFIEFQPYLNFIDDQQSASKQGVIDVTGPDGIFCLISEKEQEFRRQPYNRLKQKIEHMSRMVDKIKYANHSEDTRKTLYEHKRILEESLREFLRIDDS